MSNIIGLYKNCEDINEWLGMSNGGTAVFLMVLILSGTAIAQSKKEKELIIWFAEHDRTATGMGNSGFDISDIPWSIDTFDKEKEFILKVIDGAFQKINWEVLDYELNEELIFEYLNTFRELIMF